MHFFYLVVLLLFPQISLAVSPSEIILETTLEEKAREISKDLRCLVCQNQSIDDSDSRLAKDLRLLVREKLQAGEKSGDIKDYIVSRYGEFVLLKPPLNMRTSLLWFSPVILLFLGIIVAFLFFRKNHLILKSQKKPIEKLNASEKQQLDKILGDID